MAKLYNLARMTTTTTGTGTITLASAATSYLTFSAAGVSDGDVVTYAIADGDNREIGRGTYTASGTTLSRDTILDSTNSGSAINLSGSAEVFITAAAEDINPIDGIFYLNNQTVAADYTLPSSTNAGTFGPVTVDSGVTVTIPSGSTWTIV